MSEHVNLAPGSVVPESGKYRCSFCGPGGIAETQLKAREMMGSLNQYLPPISESAKQFVRQTNVRYFEKGKKFPACPFCGFEKTGWTFLGPTSEGMPPKHDDAIEETGVCDVCLGRVQHPSGYILTTREIVAAPAYWDYYFDHFREDFRRAGVLSFDAFSKNRASLCKPILDQNTPWLVCERCVSKFDVDKKRAADYVNKWYSSRRTFKPPGTGAAPVSAVRMRGDRGYASPGTMPDNTRRWWQFWKV